MALLKTVILLHNHKDEVHEELDWIEHEIEQCNKQLAYLAGSGEIQAE